jgi:hypothetical protein
MARKNRKCLSCGTTYKYCPTCSGEDRMKPAWYAQFCCEECKTLWGTATEYNMKMISKEEAKEIISGLSLKPHAEYVECVQNDLKNILEEPKPATVEEAAPKTYKEPKKEQKQFKVPKQKEHEVVEEK